jgi:transcriptional regulator with XRE-family HTH domain
MDKTTTEHNAAFEGMFAEAEKTEAYWVSTAKIRFTEDMLQAMRLAGVNKTQLAERLGVKPAQITRLCSGANNFTVETMVRIARALKGELKVQLISGVSNPAIQPGPLSCPRVAEEHQG